MIFKILFFEKKREEKMLAVLERKLLGFEGYAMTFKIGNRCITQVFNPYLF